MSRKIYKTAVQVTAFSTIEKVLSFFYRIVLSRSIGSEGLGIYQICLSVFAVFLTISSSGIPITVSRLITKHNAINDKNGAHSAVSAGILCALIVAVPIFLILFFANNFFSFLFSDKRCMPIFLILLPGLALTSVYAVLRGAFWGNKQFLPYSLIELAEDSIMVVLGCIFVSFATDALSGAMGAAYAVLISYVFSFIVSILWYKVKGGKFVNPKPQLKAVISSATPITAMRTASSTLNSIIAVILPLILINVGYSPNQATSLYGIVLGMAVPILFIPTSLIGSIAVVIAPELSENYYKNRKIALKNDVEKSLKSSVFIAILIIPFLFVLGNELCLFLYSDTLSGEVVQKCSFVLLPMCVSMITNTVLNSMNCEIRTLFNYLISAVAMLISIFAFTASFGIWSYLIGLFLSFIITAILNLRLLYKKCKGIKLSVFFVKCIVCCSLCCVFGTMFKNLLTNFPLIAKTAICGVVLLSFIFASLCCFDILSFKKIKKFFPKRKLKDKARVL